MAIDIPPRPLAGFFERSAAPRVDVWRRLAQATVLIATDSHSTYVDLAEQLTPLWRLQSRGGGLHRLLAEYLPRYGLAVSEAIHTVGRRGELGLIRLTCQGKALARALGVEPVAETDWERIIRLHQGEQQAGHAALLLRFDLIMRRRGGRTTLLPKVNDPLFQPDILIEFDEPPIGPQRVYVEVEGKPRRPRPQKWQNQARYQGFVALCAKTPAGRASLVKQCQEAKVAVIATDLETLIKQKNRVEPIGPLWLEHWPLAPSRNVSAGTVESITCLMGGH